MGNRLYTDTHAGIGQADQVTQTAWLSHYGTERLDGPVSFGLHRLQFPGIMHYREEGKCASDVLPEMSPF